MITWILVLTISTGEWNGGLSVHSVPGFKTKEACMFAGSAWLKQMKESRVIRPMALCVSA